MDQLQPQTAPTRSPARPSRDLSPYPLTPSGRYHTSQAQLPPPAPARQPQTQDASARAEQTVAQQTSEMLASLFSPDPQGYGLHVNYDALGALLGLPAADRAILLRMALLNANEALAVSTTYSMSARQAATEANRKLGELQAWALIQDCRAREDAEGLTKSQKASLLTDKIAAAVRRVYALSVNSCTSNSIKKQHKALLLTAPGSYGLTDNVYTSQKYEKVREEIEEIVKAQVSSHPGNLRTTIFKSCQDNWSLDAFGKYMFGLYVPGRNKPEEKELAQFALLRTVAATIIPNAAPKTDTGFWNRVEKDLEECVTKYGQSRTDKDGVTTEKWAVWYKYIIQCDRGQFGTPVVEE
ncbi:hypothetical protein PENSPDRAFT_693255 [Peniophora sp. CONT]|nr:hypothetical protein PENSPDRAFT_693255 [Peniophora sp. CONT]